MPTPFESALLNLKLFELRREPVLREARDWFLREFNPENFGELIALVSSERNASFRMVLGYWDFAASLVTSGAINGEAFLAAHGEAFAAFSKIQPFL
jgi:ribosome biogenesis protein Tsr3